MLSASRRSRWSTAFYRLITRIHLHLDRDSGQSIAEIDSPDTCHQERVVNHVQQTPSDEHADDGKTADPDPPFVEFQSAGFGGEEPEDAVAIERRKREQVEAAEQQIEGEEHAENHGDAFGDAASRGGLHYI